jgi:hypothetical protein
MDGNPEVSAVCSCPQAKMVSRVHLLGPDMARLQDIVAPEDLPEFLGGTMK